MLLSWKFTVVKATATTTLHNMPHPMLSNLIEASLQPEVKPPWGPFMISISQMWQPGFRKDEGPTQGPQRPSLRPPLYPSCFCSPANKHTPAKVLAQLHNHTSQGLYAF